jgi:hypothetical protein
VARQGIGLTPAPVETLTRRRLNRALLERQLLLRRVSVAVEAAIERLVGIQAQAPRAPYVALWSRLEGFQPDALADLLVSRRVVRALVLLRTTIHLVTADDALAMRPVLQPVAERGFRSGSPFARTLGEIDLGALLSAGHEALDERPLTVAQLAKVLGPTWPDHDPMSPAMAVRYLVPLVQPPPRGLWNENGPSTMATTEAWLGRPLPAGSSSAEPDGFVLRYLAAFGPASVADIAAWSWLTGVAEMVERLRPRLRIFRDEAGRELFDVPDGPLPDPETPAPPRYLPEYDNILLSHKDRSRVIPPGWKIPLAAGDGARVGMFLLDGFVGGTWRIDVAVDPAILTLEPLTRLGASDEEDVAGEAVQLGSFIAGRRTEVRIAPPA